MPVSSSSGSVDPISSGGRIAGRVPSLKQRGGRHGTHRVPGACPTPCPIGRTRRDTLCPTYRGHGVGTRCPGHGRGTRSRGSPNRGSAACKCEKHPPPSPQGGGSEQAVVKDEKSCPKCFGKGLDAFGKPCDYVRPVEPVVHTSGIKKWDDATKAWVDTLPGGDVFTVEGGGRASIRRHERDGR